LIFKVSIYSGYFLLDLSATSWERKIWIWTYFQYHPTDWYSKPVSVFEQGKSDGIWALMSFMTAEAK